MQRTAILNGSNINYDKDYSLSAVAMMTPWVVEGLEVTTNSVAIGKAFIQVTRTSVTPNEVFYILFENTSAVTIDTTWTKKVFIKIPKANVNDPWYNQASGVNIATIQTDTDYPAEDYIPLASITAGVITDAREFVKIKWKQVDGVLSEAKSENIASATTTDLSDATWNTIHITWTTTITSFWNVEAGVKFTLIFDWILTLTHHATSLILPTWANIVTAVWDTCEIVSEWGWNWRVVSYTRKDWSALFSIATDRVIRLYNNFILWEVFSANQFARMWNDIVWTPIQQLVDTGWYNQVPANTVFQTFTSLSDTIVTSVTIKVPAYEADWNTQIQILNSSDVVLGTSDTIYYIYTWATTNFQFNFSTPCPIPANTSWLKLKLIRSSTLRLVPNTAWWYAWWQAYYNASIDFYFSIATRTWEESNKIYKANSLTSVKWRPIWAILTTWNIWDTKTIITWWIITWFTSLTPWEIYYLKDDYTIWLTAWTISIKVWRAISSTELLFIPYL